MDCEHYEVEIEKRAHGALSPETSAALDHHVADCPSCRAFVTTVQELGKAMHANTTHGISNVDWSRLERGFSAMTANYRQAVPRIAVAALPMIALITWASSPGERLLTGLLSAAVVVTILVVGVVVRRRTDAKLAAVAGQRAEFVAAYRAELEVTIRRLRHARVYLPAFGALWLAIGVSQLIAGKAAVTSAFWIGIGVLLLVQAIVAYRQLGHRLRERAELG